MTLLVVISGEEELGRTELEELARAYQCKLEIRGRIATLSGPKELVERLAYSKLAGELLASGPFDSFPALMDNPYFKEDHTGFSVEVWKLDREDYPPSTEIKRMFGDLIKGRPNLAEPREVFDLVLQEGQVWIARRIWYNDPKQFLAREPVRRPVFHPASIKPKLGRFLVNLSGLLPGQTLLDPFCGIGGIIIEAGLLGLIPTGIELDKRWAWGAKRNLEYYGVPGKVIHADFLEWQGGRFDAIVTDLPYGRSSRLLGNQEEFYRKAFTKFLDHSNKAVIMGPTDLGDILASSGWNTRRKIKIRVHRSLDRWIHVCEI